LSDLGWLFIAMAAVWVGIGGYILSVALRQRRVERRLDELEERAHR
jgi:CcmD family protein